MTPIRAKQKRHRIRSNEAPPGDPAATLDYCGRALIAIAALAQSGHLRSVDTERASRIAETAQWAVKSLDSNT